ncbi:MAG: ABC transporter ATP-binding protein [Rhodobacteraceae bacterium]|nr:ABC transporter ATP-binding protein [Paracoccaceae bacterium]
MTSVSVQHLDLSFGSVQVLKDLNIDIEEGEFLVLLGPSGCGKSTLLNCIAGLLDITGGQIHISGKNVTWAEPKDRGIGMVFQSYALYPQMTVRGNLSFGLKTQKFSRAEIKERVSRVADILQIQDLLNRKPGALSGGQRQRVAIGRALVRDVDVYLFDEPLSNLDAKLRTELRVELKQLHNRLQNTMIYVTHDQIEAMTLADRIAIMRDGFIQQLADPYTVYNRPTNLFVAGFVGSPGMSFVDGKISGDGSTFTFGNVTVPLAEYDGDNTASTSSDVKLGLRPEHTTVHRAAIEGKTVVANLELVEALGSESLLYFIVEDQRISALVDADEKYEQGSTLHLEFNIGKASLFDSATEERL